MHEYEGTFQGRPAHFRMTSVIGHVLRYSVAARICFQQASSLCHASQHILATGETTCAAALLSIDCLVTAGVTTPGSC